MSTYALDGKKGLIKARDALRGADYTCLECGTKVRLKMGEERKAHFYHLEPTVNCRQSGKSLEHLMTQLNIQKAFHEQNQELILEKRFDSIQRIADCVSVKEKIVFEIQCSPMTALEAKERMRDYQLCGYQVVWVLHTKTFLNNKATAFEKLLTDTPHYFTNIDQEGKGEIFDLLSPIRKGYRLKSSKRFPIKIDTFNPRLPKNTLFRNKWQLVFQGDILSHLEQKSLDEKTRESIFQHLFLEKEPSHDKQPFSLFTFLQKGLFHVQLFFEEQLRAAASKS